MVDVEQTVNDCMGHIVELQEQQGGLCLQSGGACAPAVHEERMKMVRVDVDMTALCTASKLGQTLTPGSRDFGQRALATARACLAFK